jgi:hypothetical protein
MVSSLPTPPGSEAAPRDTSRSMPKAAPTLFEVEGVECSVKDGLVNVGLNAGWPSSIRYPVKVSKALELEQIKEKVAAHAKFPVCTSHARGHGCNF